MTYTEWSGPTWQNPYPPNHPGLTLAEVLDTLDQRGWPPFMTGYGDNSGPTHADLHNAVIEALRLEMPPVEGHTRMGTPQVTHTGAQTAITHVTHHDTFHDVIRRLLPDAPPAPPLTTWKDHGARHQWEIAQVRHLVGRDG